MTFGDEDDDFEYRPTRGRKRIACRTVETEDGPRLDLGPIHVWGGDHLALIRDTVRSLIAGGAAAVALDLTHALSLPSGLYGLLADFADAGTEVRLFAPTPAVRRMLWFRRHAEPIGAGVWRLTGEPQEEFTAAGVGRWDVTPA